MELLPIHATLPIDSPVRTHLAAAVYEHLYRLRQKTNNWGVYNTSATQTSMGMKTSCGGN